jgi:hypothetical protein
MLLKLALSAGLLTAIGMTVVPSAFAQTTTGSTPTVGDTRSPTLGDPGSKPVPTPRRRPHLVRHPSTADAPGPGQTTGNPPDRAAAGGGGR